MPVSLGTTTVTALFLGTTSITSAYLGATQVFGGSFTPLSLFSGGAQGIWLDPSDLSTMFSDRAGTTPVTTPGAVVGLRLDKSKGLTLGAELVTNGGFATDSDWTKGTGWTISSGVAAYAGGANGNLSQAIGISVGKRYAVTFTLNITAGTPTCSVYVGAQADAGANAAFTASGTYTAYLLHSSSSGLTIRGAGVSGASFTIDNISVRELPGNHAVAPTDAARPTYGVEPKGGRRNLLLATDTLSTQSLTVTAVAHTLAFTGTGTVTLSGASIAGPLIGTGASDRVSLTFTPTAASLTLTVVGSVTLGQLELGSSATAYQKVVTAYNVTESGVATTHYVQYDGSDDSMSTAAIDFTATDKMSVFAGVRKLSDAATGTLLDLNGAAGIGTIMVRAPSGTAANYAWFAGGSLQQSAISPSSYAAPISNVLTGLADISGDLATLRANGTQVAQVTADQGTGNFSNLPLFLGRRQGTSLPFNGRDYGLIIVGKTASAGEITDTETWLAAKTAQVTL